MRDLARTLAEAPVLRGLPDEDLELLAGCARNVRFAAGAWIFREGGAADTFYWVRQGQVALSVHAPGQGELTIDTVHEGEILGFSWLFPPYRWQFDARAVTAVAALAFDGACLRGKAEADPRLGYRLMTRIAPVVVARLQAARVRLLDLYGAHA